MYNLKQYKQPLITVWVWLLCLGIGYAWAQMMHHHPDTMDTKTHMDHDMSAGHHAVMHHWTQEVASTTQTPTLNVSFKEDSADWLTLHLQTTNFTFTPESVDTTEVVQNQGHAHLYINDKKISRIYSDYYHISSDWLGEHNNITVTLNADNHDERSVDGQSINQTVHFMPSINTNE